MDILLIVIIVVIVVAIGFILSRPFMEDDAQENDSQELPDYHDQYRKLLEEIKSIQQAYADESMPKHLSKRLNEKKIEAAQLLQLINEQNEESN